MLISEKTSEALDELVGAYFSLNRSFDRSVSVMLNAWAMPNSSDIIHHNLAHLFPIMADRVTAIKDNYNLTSVYPETHRDAREYDNLYDMWETMLKEVLDVYEIIKMVNKIAMDNNDFNVHSELIKIMQWHNVIVGQVWSLRDKAEQNPDDFDRFDARVRLWGIDGIPELMEN